MDVYYGTKILSSGLIAGKQCTSIASGQAIRVANNLKTTGSRKCVVLIFWYIHRNFGYSRPLLNFCGSHMTFKLAMLDLWSVVFTTETPGQIYLRHLSLALQPHKDNNKLSDTRSLLSVLI
jgi:hypothetical protein